MIKAVATAVGAAERAPGQPQVQPLYLEALTLVERLHRRLLDVIKDEFDRRGRADINSVQALLLYNIGDKELTAGELRTRGYYLGSNVSYNLKKLVELGFLDHQRSRVDRRSVRIRLTSQGQEIRRIVDAGLVEREIPPDDRRSVRLSLTKAGRAFVDKHKATLRRSHDAERAALSDREYETIVALLRKVTGARGDA